MDRDLDRQEYETWDRVLTNVVAHDHIVQLYQDQDFLNRAVCRFAGAGLANGEGVILVSTLAHWNGFQDRSHPAGMLGRDFVTGDEDSSNHRR